MAWSNCWRSRWFKKSKLKVKIVTPLFISRSLSVNETTWSKPAAVTRDYLLCLWELQLQDSKSPAALDHCGLPTDQIKYKVSIRSSVLGLEIYNLKRCRDGFETKYWLTLIGIRDFSCQSHTMPTHVAHFPLGFVAYSTQSLQNCLCSDHELLFVSIDYSREDSTKQIK